MDVFMENSNGIELTDAENELYDRQIRLWGLESQKRLRAAKVLISCLNGLGAEVAKNIILSGVNSVKLHDDKLVTEHDFCSQFLAPRSAIGTNRAEASLDRAKQLNPMVEISADTEPLEKKNAEFYSNFDVIVILGAQSSEILHINEICRQKNIKFFCGDVWGMFGYYCADLQEHKFVEDVVKYKITKQPNGKIKSETISSTAERELKYPPLSKIFKFDFNTPAYSKKIKQSGPGLIVLRAIQKFRDSFNRDPDYKCRDKDILELEKIRDTISNAATVPSSNFIHIFTQISPATAVVGGVLAQEVIKVVSKKEAPHCNLFLFNPETCCGSVETIGLD